MNVQLKIDKLNVYETYGTYTNVVHSAIFTLTVTLDSGQTASSQQLAKFSPGNLSDYVAYEALSYDVVKGWIEKSVDISTLTDHLVEMAIASQTTVLKDQTPPWVIS